MTMKERIRQGKLFTDMCEGMPKERTNAKKLQKKFNDSNPGNTVARMALLAQIFGKPTFAWIEPPFYFCYGKHISLGKGCYINVNCNFIDDGEIRIGNKVMFGPAVTIATVGHPINPELREYMYCDPVSIGDNCWIGANSVICPGVTIGENTVIGAGSVVTKDIPANVVAAGNPCKVIREINENDLKYYYRDRRISEEDLAEERTLRNAKYSTQNIASSHSNFIYLMQQSHPRETMAIFIFRIIIWIHLNQSQGSIRKRLNFLRDVIKGLHMPLGICA